MPIVKNLGIQVINNFRLVFIFPAFSAFVSGPLYQSENVQTRVNEKSEYVVSYQSRGVLFPLEERNIGEEIKWNYSMNSGIYQQLSALEQQNQQAVIPWTLYADNMTPKQGAALLNELHDY